MSITISSYICSDEGKVVEKLLHFLEWDDERARKVEGRAQEFVEAIRGAKRSGGQLESFLQHYSLSTDEGMALMCLAEALLRIPDKSTANDLIEDKMDAGDMLIGSSEDWVVKAAGVGLFITRKTLDSAFSHVGKPFIREAMVKAMGVLGSHFILGGDIEQAYQNAQKPSHKLYRLSYDMLGEGARTRADAHKFFESYANAIRYIGARIPQSATFPPGISVKLSALYPRYEYAQKERCIPVMFALLKELCQLAAASNMALTIDAEEMERLELSLELVENILSDPDIPKEWDGFGLAVQAYQKHAIPLIDRLAGLSKIYERRLQIRLVKGAYWDTEIKRAQVLGLHDYPVFTRKMNTDTSYLACAQRLLDKPECFYPMFATHNAHSVAAILDMVSTCKTPPPFEFQRLYGMGGPLFDLLISQEKVPASIYAPVGAHEELLPYLVRRLLENGANSSFVNLLLNESEPVESLIRDPVKRVRNAKHRRHPKIKMPEDLFRKEPVFGRKNSKGIDLNDSASVQRLLNGLKRHSSPYEAVPLIGGRRCYKDSNRGSVPEEVKNPGDLSDNLGLVWPATKSLIDPAFETACAGFKVWSVTPAADRSDVLEKLADLIEHNYCELMALCIREAGKTISDAHGEIREAVDFCRYYANRGRSDFDEAGSVLPGPTGELNVLSLHGRGVFVCISPWNFPLAIFTGQVVAALMAGNAVIAKPAEQTPLIAYRIVELMHEAGVPGEALNLMTGDGRIGAALVAHRDVAGVAFTGSTDVAREINKVIADKRGAIVPLIAETGGQNVMIVDSSALPEQVVDTVILSAFGSAGQRCSALRVLCVQEEIAPKIIRMLKGAMQERYVGYPGELSSDIGPVIDEEAYGNLVRHRESLKGFGHLLYEVPLDEALKRRGHYFAPCAYEVADFKGLDREVFGPILHVIRYKKGELFELVEEINDTGYGLTFGVHSRIEHFQNEMTASVNAGNVYINRSMIGAVVGSQPFGGQGLSGTGPKAGGPYYLARFAHERVVSIDTTATGGNASLVSLEE